jgi:hypothetical protein
MKKRPGFCDSRALYKADQPIFKVSAAICSTDTGPPGRATADAGINPSR